MASDIIITPKLTPEQTVVLNRQVRDLDRLLDDPSRSPQPLGQTGILEQIGRLLWEASGLNRDELLDALDAARDAEIPVRLIVTDATLHHLPWELLFHDNLQLGFVARHPWCVVARRFRGNGSQQPRMLPKPFRLLLFIASPEDLDPARSRLDFEREEELLFTALDRPLAQGEVRIDVAEDGCLSTLIERLEAHRYHAVIFSMHGTPARNKAGKEEWGLLFEDERTGRSAPVAGSDLSAQLDQLPAGHRPGLIVLSACRSATAEESANPISSIACQLHERGIERVLGMRLSVLDAAASAFSAELFRRVARGESLGRAVTLARRTVAQGIWLGMERSSATARVEGDLYAQWTLPVLLDRTADGPLVDIEAAVAIEEPAPVPTVLPGDGTIQLPTRADFIGRRTFIRQHVRAFLDGDRRCLLLTGPGGVGKTTLAGLLARKLRERYPTLRLLGFRAPFDLKLVYEALWQEAFDGSEEPALLPRLQAEADVHEQMRLVLMSLVRRQRPCAFVLDNLEALQDLHTLRIAPAPCRKPLCIAHHLHPAGPNAGTAHGPLCLAGVSGRCDDTMSGRRCSVWRCAA